MGGSIKSSDEPERPLHWAAKIPLFLGSVAILVAMTADSLAVVGRHANIPLLGTVEIVQLAASIAGGATIICATIAGAHASIHVLTDRVSPEVRHRLLTFARLMTAIFFVALTIGCGWLMVDMLGQGERTELTGMPLMPFRLLATLAFGATALLYVIALFKPEKSKQ
ncbi:MAG: TRAP transporter small permease [Asticcacaulis sp.]